MSQEPDELVVTSRRPTAAVVEWDPRGHAVLDGRFEWTVRGSQAVLERLERELAPHAERLGDVVLLSFGNTVGWFRCSGLGTFEVRSGKWSCKDFDDMVRDIGRVAGSLPFGRAKGGWMFERRHRVDPQVLLHQFFYLRSVLDSDYRADDALLPALRRVLADPHRRLEATERRVPVERCTAVGPRELLRIACGDGLLRSVPASRSAVALRLGGRLPVEVRERVNVVTYDTPENRFVRCLLGQIGRILDEVEHEFVRADGPGVPGMRHEVHRLRAMLAPVVRARLWESVGDLDRAVADSPVLQRKAGYRACFVVHSRLQLGAAVPPLPRQFDRILALRDVAELYELWCYFRVAELLSRRLGTAVAADRPTASAGSLRVPHAFRIGWACGSELLYNASFRRGGARHSYSVPLRPDIALVMRGGANAGLHLLDAKFRVGSPSAADRVARSDERTFQRGDLHKMHAYRDAIRRARSAWVLYPGTRDRFWSDGREGCGVGVAGLRPGDEESGWFVLERLV